MGKWWFVDYVGVDYFGFFSVGDGVVSNGGVYCVGYVFSFCVV